VNEIIDKLWIQCRPLDFVILAVLAYNTWKVRFLTKIFWRFLNDGEKEEEKDE
jgi:hypothetical protein